MWNEATTDMVPFVFGGMYNGPGEWLNGLGFDVTGGFYVAEGSFAGYESATMYSPTLDTTIAVATTKMPNAINPPPIMQALAIALYGDDVDFGLTLDQAMAPNLGSCRDRVPASTTVSTERIAICPTTSPAKRRAICPHSRSSDTAAARSRPRPKGSS